MVDRIEASQKLLKTNGIFCSAIDDVEGSNLRQLLQNLFEKKNELGIVAVCSNPGGRKRPRGFAPAHEYAMFFGMTEASQISRLEWTEKQLKNYKNVDEKGYLFQWRPLRKSGGPNARRSARRRLFYPIFVKNNQIRIPKMEWNTISEEWSLIETPIPGETIVWPIDENNQEMTWNFEIKTLKEELALSKVSAKTYSNGDISIRFKRFLNEEGTLPTTWWGKIEYSGNENEENQNKNKKDKKKMKTQTWQNTQQHHMELIC